MPVVIVAAAVWGGAALAAGGLTLLGTIAAVGAVAAGVGVVTGNKDLMKAGSVMGLVGGVGALAESAGVMSTAATAESSTAGAEQLSGPPPDTTATQGAVAKDTMSSAAPDVAKDVAQTTGTAASTAPAATPASATPGPEQLSGPVDATASTIATPSPTPNVLDSVKPFFDRTGQFIKDNQMFSYGLMQIGGAAMQGLFDPTKAAQVDLLDANAKLAQQRAANIAAGVPNATTNTARPNVFRNATAPTYTAPQIGLLNSPVTGKPA